MVKKIISDLHVHSLISEDGRNSVDEMVRSAIGSGIKYIAFTEHVDNHTGPVGAGHYDHEKYTDEINNAKKIYGNDIVILKGIEFGEPHIHKEAFKMETKKDYDVIMASLHELSGEFVGDRKLIEKYSFEGLMQRYYQALLDVVDNENINVLAHFDFPCRYHGYFEPDMEQLKRILMKIIKNNIAVEINASGFRKGYGHTMPNALILREYLNCGGSMVTFGSDAHDVQSVGNDFTKACEYLKDVIEELKIGVFQKKKFIELR